MKNSILFAIVFLAPVVTYYLARQKRKPYKDLPQEGMTYASLPRRALANIIDSIFILVIVFLTRPLWGPYASLFQVYDLTMVKNAYAMSYTVEYTDSTSSPFLIDILVSILYFVPQQASKYQATVGMRMMGIKIYDPELKKPTAIILAARYLSSILSAVILFIGFLMIAWTRRKQGLHDILARTVVCREW